jgi:hypothetical protein
MFAQGRRNESAKGEGTVLCFNLIPFIQKKFAWLSGGKAAAASASREAENVYQRRQRHRTHPEDGGQPDFRYFSD